MSHRKRCMGGVFSKILRLLGLLKDPPLPAAFSASPSPPPAPTTISSSSNNHNIPPVAVWHHKPDTHHAVPPGVEHKAPDRPPASRTGSFKKIFMNKDASPADKASNVKPTGFRVRVSVPTNKESPGPVVLECTSGSGGVQGLHWYSEKLMMDEDGDVAQEFLDEVMSQASGPLSGYPRILPRFKPKMKTRPAQLEGPVCTCDGNIV